MNKKLLYEENTSSVGKREAMKNLFYSIILFAISIFTFILSTSQNSSGIEGTYVLLGISILTLILGILFLYGVFIGFTFNNLKIYEDRIVLPMPEGIINKKEVFLLFRDIKQVSMNENGRLHNLQITLKNGKNEILFKDDVQDVSKIKSVIEQQLEKMKNIIT